MDEIPQYNKIERFLVGDLKEQMESQVKACEILYSLPRRDLALHASLATKPQTRGELLGNAEVILDWLNQDGCHE